MKEQEESVTYNNEEKKKKNKRKKREFARSRFAFRSFHFRARNQKERDMEGEVTDASPPTTASVSEEALREVASNRNDDEIADPERVDQVISEASIKSLTNALQGMWVSARVLGCERVLECACECVAERVDVVLYLGEHVSEVLYMLQEDDLWMPRVMARRVENLEVSIQREFTSNLSMALSNSLWLTSINFI